MACSNIDDSSSPSTYQPQASEHSDTLSRVNALLVATAALLHSHPGNVHDVLPHLSPDAPSSVCPSYMTQRLPQRKLLDTLASLVAFHPACPAAAVALEATPDRVGLYIVAQTPNQALPTSMPNEDPVPANLKLRADVEAWCGLVRAIAYARSPSSTHPPKTATATATDLGGGADVMHLPDTQLPIAVFRACYPALRMHLRALPLGVLLRKFEGCATTMALVSLASMRPPDAHEDALARLGEHLEVLLRLTEPGDAAAIEDENHFVALHVAGRFALRALRDEAFCAFLNRIDCETVEVIEQACYLSQLVTSLVSIAKSSSTEGALALPWHIEWIAPQPTPPSFEATIDPPLLREWLAGIPWEDSPFLDRPPDLTTWPYSQVVAELLRDVPSGLVRRTSSESAGVAESESGDENPENSHVLGRHSYTRARAKGHMPPGWSHCEMALLRHLADPAHAVLAYPYIATSHTSCYPCAMLARALGVVHGHSGGKFVLRGCEARVDLPWPGIAASRRGGGSESESGSGEEEEVEEWGLDVARALEEGLLADLRSLMAARAEQLVELREVGVLEDVPEVLGGVLRWR